VIAQGPVERVYTAANLRRAYGGQIALIERGEVAATAAGGGG